LELPIRLRLVLVAQMTLLAMVAEKALTRYFLLSLQQAGAVVVVIWPEIIKMVVQAAVEEAMPSRLDRVTLLLQIHRKETMAAVRQREEVLGQAVINLVVAEVVPVRLEELLAQQEQTRKQEMAALAPHQVLLVRP
jgi:hypothetical protein